MIKLKTKMNICGKIYKIISRKFLIETKEDYAYGICRSIEKIIEIYTDTQKEVVFDSLVHEMIHAISDEYALDLTEDQVRNLGINLTDTLLRNDIIKLNF